VLGVCLGLQCIGELYGGSVVRADHPDPAAYLHGVVAPDRAEAVQPRSLAVGGVDDSVIR